MSCPQDTNGDGDCGRPACPTCGEQKVKYRRVLVCDKWTFPVLEGKGGYFKWMNKSLRIVGHNALQEEWILDQHDLRGLRVFEPFGGLAMASTIVRNLLEPVHQKICEIDSDCLVQLQYAMSGYPNTEIGYGDAFVTLRTVEAQLYILDWPGYTIYQYPKWAKQFTAMLGRGPRAVTYFDSSAVYLPTHRDRYTKFTDYPVKTREDYAYATSKFMWERHGYSVTRVVEEPCAHMAYFMLRPVPINEIEFHTVPRDGGGFKFID